MKKIYRGIVIFFLLFVSIHYCQTLWAVNPEGTSGSKLVSISGYVKDSKTGEVLTGATIYIKEIKKATSTNQYGFYSISMLPGSYTVQFTYLGYESVEKNQNLLSNIVLNIEMSEGTKVLDEVVVKASRPEDNIKKPEMSISKLEMKTIRQVPALMGEVDVIKVIQMLPGVLPTSEGTSGFSVRGGGIDQNLIILDEATVYNASHLMGFFSVFNNDAIRDVKLYKGDIPASYGGRLSSVLDVRMKEGNTKKITVTGGVGLISSRLTVEGPIINEKTSFLISGRRTYADLFFPLLTDSNAKKSILYFYDLNFKLNHQFSDNDRLYLSAYLGRDIFGEKGSSDAGFGNKTATLRWNHQFSSRLFSNLTAIVSNYDYKLQTQQGGSNYVWNSNLLDYSLKADFNFYPNPDNEIKFGISSIFHVLNPIDAWIQSDSLLVFPNLKNYELEHAIYVYNQQKIGDKVTLKYGIRYSVFQNMGKTKLNTFDANHEYTGTINYKSGEIFNTYPHKFIDGLEPRLGFVYSVSDMSSIKASYSRTIQYLQLASVSNGGMPLDYWFPANPNIKPQKANQYAIGYFRNLANNQIEASVETFYKQMYDVIDFRDHTQPLFNALLDGDVRTGTAKSYGIEFLIKKNEGKFYGWISYTLSRAIRNIPEINNGQPYPAPYDKPNNINIIVNYEISPEIIFSANWVFASGTPITFPIGSQVVGNTAVPIYSGRNEYRMRDYHRLDLSLTLKGAKKPGRLWQGEWVFSIYNAYGRHNDWMLNFDLENHQAQRTYLPFLFFPGITYNFSF
jgi:TonB dependent receptor/CarboxypepD_reg-like domain/TonB-dependent Receptor Plug Domain